MQYLLMIYTNEKDETALGSTGRNGAAALINAPQNDGSQIAASSTKRCRRSSAEGAPSSKSVNCRNILIRYLVSGRVWHKSCSPGRYRHQVAITWT